MRLVLKLKSIHSDRIAINYNYPLSASIYKLLRFSSNEFTEFLCPSVISKQRFNIEQLKKITNVTVFIFKIHF